MREATDAGEVAHRVVLLLDRAQKRFGAARMELGAILATIQDFELWRGQSSSFAALLDERRINSSAAYQYMRVARAFFFALGVDGDVLDELSSVPMGVLDLAAKVATAENIDDVVAQITALRERDARVVLEAMAAGRTPDPPRTRLSPRVARLASAFWDLPDDQRIEFMHSLQRPAAGQKTAVTEDAQATA